MSKKSSDNKPSQTQQLFDNMVNLYYASEPYTRTNIYHELEVKFGTKNKDSKQKPFTKTDYNNIIKKLNSLGFECSNPEGEYILRISDKYLDVNTGELKYSNVRTEINGLNTIQEYCKTQNISELYKNSPSLIQFNEKSSVLVNKDKDGKEKEFLRDVYFEDFNFSVSYKIEKRIKYNKIDSTLENLEKNPKSFRYINRVTFYHKKYQIKFDISIVKSSKDSEVSDVFDNQKNYEFELEVINNKIGPGTEFNSPEIIKDNIRKCIKVILSGLQETNYPISISDQNNVIKGYMNLILNEEWNYKKKIFIGPSPVTLQVENIIKPNENYNVPNIRKNYVVTEKADGKRALMYISSNGKIYLINSNMNVMFTGSLTENKYVFNTILDGELILHNKFGKFINLYAAFDIYYINSTDIRSYPFIKVDSNDKSDKYRYPKLKSVVNQINGISVLNNEISPIKITVKEFLPIKFEKDSIFEACKKILDNVDKELYEYNTDGLIFTPALLGVGSDEINVARKPGKKEWEYAFKWKPSEYNTIDFLVVTKKNENNTDIITPLFESGEIMTDINSIEQYKTLILNVGFDESKHAFLNPCQDIIDDKLPNNEDNKDNKYNKENKRIYRPYKPMRFYPTNPYDINAGICKIMLSPDSKNVLQMKTEENEVFEDNTIVEFRYDESRKEEWRWVPLRVRDEKTAKLENYLLNPENNDPEYGNAYHTADNNWKSINIPVTKEMITTGNDIPDVLSLSEGVYYNRFSSSNKTKSMRDFHNLYVKKILITGVSKKGDTLIDYACGKAGDLSKWISAELSFVFGIDLSSDNLENRLDGACARFLRKCREMKNIPYCLFVIGDSNYNIRNGSAMKSDKAKQITKAIFGEGPRNEEIGKGVLRQYGKGIEGFNVSSCQFAIHYFMKNIETLKNFVRNVSECTKIGGYFIGTSYDGKTVFNMLKNKNKDESIQINVDGNKIWEIKKLYSKNEFKDDSSCLGYEIGVFQESINQMIGEYLVNYDYLNRVMESYGFKLINKKEANQLGLPEGSGLFNELYNQMKKEVKNNENKKNELQDAINMSDNERKISFLNRYFVYKKIRTVNTSKVVLNNIEDDNEEDGDFSKEETKHAIEVAKEEVKELKPKVIKLNSKLRLVEATEAADEENKNLYIKTSEQKEYNNKSTTKKNKETIKETSKEPKNTSRKVKVTINEKKTYI